MHILEEGFEKKDLKTQCRIGRSGSLPLSSARDQWDGTAERRNPPQRTGDPHLSELGIGVSSRGRRAD